MCGFVGIFDFNFKLDVNKAKDALATIKHRGPDASNFFTDNQNYFIGHNRLSIIDLSEGANQPFISSDGKFFIMFNGEIYNYKELKESILLPFLTNSDTEVILQGFLNEGVSFFKRLRGMYAFVIGELGTNNFWIVRDPIGIKPLYIYRSESCLITASEIKVITNYIGKSNLEINELAIKSYIHNGYVSEPDTVYSQIKALRPGVFMEFKNGNFQEFTFFEFEFDGKNKKPDYNVLETALENAVKRNLVADIDISIALSGGIDSSLIYYLANQQQKGIKAVSVGMKEKEFDETETSENYVNFLNGNITKTIIQPNFDLAQLNKLFLHFDQPFSDTSLIPVYYLTQTARLQSKVIIGGDGGDELFNGYPFMHLVYKLSDNIFISFCKKALDLFSSLLPPTVKRQLFRIGGVIGKDVSEGVFNINSWIPINTKFNNKSIFKYDTNEVVAYNTNYSTEKAETKAGKIIKFKFRRVLLSDYLRKTDMMSMLNGLELRVPLLDEDLCKTAFEIDFKYKSTYTKTKIPLRILHKKYFKGIGSKLKKKGFRIPLDIYLSEEEKKEIIKIVLSPNSIVTKYIQEDYLKFLCEQFLKYSAVEQLERSAVYQRIVLFYSLQLWYNNNDK
jgi:asparagine synthase (glutamine-hydrolysing)